MEKLSWFNSLPFANKLVTLYVATLIPTGVLATEYIALLYQQESGFSHAVLYPVAGIALMFVFFTTLVWMIFKSHHVLINQYIDGLSKLSNGHVVSWPVNQPGIEGKAAEVMSVLNVQLTHKKRLGRLNG
ncbi:MAG: hypothetical protein HN790_06495 [Methylococcales bacterium]|nr:hypothetical protein [Methylococcales bacterium]